MTVTLELPPDTEAGLRERAAKRGQSVTDYLLTLAEFGDDLDLSLSEEEISSVQEGLAEIEAGDNGVSLEEFDRHMAETIASLKREKAVSEPFSRG